MSALTLSGGVDSHANRSDEFMETVLLVVHILVAAALVAVVLLQRSEGGGLGIGGGGGGAGGFMTTRGAADALTRTTAYLAAAFFATSIALSLIGRGGDGASSILDQVDDSPGIEESEPAQPLPPAESDIPSIPSPQ